MAPSRCVYQLLLLAITCAFQIESTFVPRPSDVIVSTDLGRIRGVILKSRLGQDFYAFRGIRYAKPPIGDLRFKAPQPVEKWTNVFDATDDGPMCPQPNGDPSDYSEDCLRLNVYSRQLPSQSGQNIQKPVIVYLHPGGWYMASGQSKNFAGPQLFMDRDIVLVTLNYRLSSLGFLATGTPEAPGNAGLKDQVQALRWIKQHISRFGGNPNSVTVVGYSAGGMSVTLHMVSPMSRGLFHKAIAMSGSAVAQWEIPPHQLDLAEKQAKLLNCSTSSGTDIVKCLKTKTTQDFMTTFRDMFDYDGSIPTILWKPVIEPDFGQERFLAEDPVKSFQNGNFMRIPLIAGITKDEFVFLAIRVLGNPNLRQELDTNFNVAAPICFLYQRNTKNSSDKSHGLRQAFLGDEPLTLENSTDGLGYLFSDGVIGIGFHRLVHLASRYTTVYQYRFSYKNRFSHFYYPGKEPYGVVHNDDFLYLFAVPGMTPLFTKQDPEDTIVERLTRMWAAFAENGPPIPTMAHLLHGALPGC